MHGNEEGKQVSEQTWLLCHGLCFCPASENAFDDVRPGLCGTVCPGILFACLVPPGPPPSPARSDKHAVDVHVFPEWQCEQQGPGMARHLLQAVRPLPITICTVARAPSSATQALAGEWRTKLSRCRLQVWSRGHVLIPARGLVAVWRWAGPCLSLLVMGVPSAAEPTWPSPPDLPGPQPARVRCLFPLPADTFLCRSTSSVPTLAM